MRVGRGVPYEWSMLRSYQRIWERSHRDAVFTLDASKVRKHRASAMVFAPLMGWVKPDTQIERRFLMAGFPPSVTYRERRAATREALRVGVQRGYIKMCDSISVPTWAYRPATIWCKTTQIAERRWKESTIEHGQLAVEAALAALSSNGEFQDGVAFETEADFLAASRSTRQIRRGELLGSIADLITIEPTGSRRATEIISENYRDTNITTKYEGLANRVDFVATSPSVARRVVAAIGAPCLHF